jgi:hypothetical protein
MRVLRLPVLALLAVAFVGGAAFADVGENFEARALALGGSVNLSLDFGNFSNLGLDYYFLGVSPALSFFPIEKTSLNLLPSLYVWGYPAGDDVNWEVSLGFGSTYFFVLDPDAYTGLVPWVGVSARIGYSGSQESIFASLEPSAGLYYFLTDRIAPYLDLSLVSLGISPGGDSLVYVALRPSLAVGMSYHLPNPERVLPGM